MDEKIAVVIPVYNVERYIDRCVKSILNQEYTNLEIILVDDGSPDNCPSICDKYAKKDDRIKVIHKKNGGLSDARNAGVLEAKSDYVVFVDSDDYVDKNYISSLVNLRKKYNVDVACAPLIYEYEDGTKKARDKFDDQILNHDEALSMVMRARHGIGVTACAKLFDKRIVKKHPFPVGKLHEDLAIAYELYDDVDKIAITSVSTYHYIQHSTSITHSTINEESFFWILGYISDMFKDNIDENLKRALVYRLFDLVNEYCRVIRYKEDRKIIIEAQRFIKKYKSIYITDPENNYMTRVKGWLLATNYWTFILFCILKKYREKS